jgi:hypothetical protein
MADRLVGEPGSANQFSRLLGPGRDLLGRVDRVLNECGVPAGHPVLPLIAQLGVLPGAAVEFVAALRPEVVRLSCALPGIQLPGLPADWAGPAAEAFGSRWRALNDYQAGLTERMAATVDFAAAAADWMAELQADIARELATVLGSAEAVSVRTSAPGRTRAAADIGFRILGVVKLFDPTDWLVQVAEVPYRASHTVGDRYGEGFVVEP